MCSSDTPRHTLGNSICHCQWDRYQEKYWPEIHLRYTIHHRDHISTPLMIIIKVHLRLCLLGLEVSSFWEWSSLSWEYLQFMYPGFINDIGSQASKHWLLLSLCGLILKKKTSASLSHISSNFFSFIFSTTLETCRSVLILQYKRINFTNASKTECDWYIYI